MPFCSLNRVSSVFIRKISLSVECWAVYSCNTYSSGYIVEKGRGYHILLDAKKNSVCSMTCWWTKHLRDAFEISSLCDLMSFVINWETSLLKNLYY